MTEMPFGWLSPKGEFYECKYYEHLDTADEIIEKNNLHYDTAKYFSPDEFLLKTGWVKFGIALLGHKEYWIHWERPMTDYQKNYCKIYFETDDLKFPMNITSTGMWKYEDDFFERR